MGRFLAFRMNFGRLSAAAAALLFIAAVLAMPSVSAAGVREGLALCANIIIPSLFPFCVAAIFLFRCGTALSLPRGRGFFLNGQFAVFLMSMTGGFPVGARLVRELYKSGAISLKKAQSMVCYCVNAGPAFVVVALGAGMLRNRAAGFILLISHLLASAVLASVFEFLSRKEETLPRAACKEKPPLGDLFVGSTADAASSVFSVSAWVVFFSCLDAVLTAALPQAPAALLGVLEVTNGLKAVAGRGDLTLCSMLLGWGGLSVHFQVLAAARETRPKAHVFFLSRLAHGGISALFTSLILSFFPLAVPAYTFGEMPASVGNAVSLPAAFSLAALSAVFMFFAAEDKRIA